MRERTEFILTLDTTDTSNEGVVRLLRGSRNLALPINTRTRLIVSSTDVIHSLAVPALGLKVDAVPGRLQQIFTNPSRVGIFYGQCSEICGRGHSFIPISIITIPSKEFEL